MKHILSCSVAIALLAFAFGAAFGQADNADHRAQAPVDLQWKYKIVELPVYDRSAEERVLNELGKAGWELVLADTRSHSGGVFRTATLKRPKVERKLVRPAE